MLEMQTADSRPMFSAALCLMLHWGSVLQSADRSLRSCASSFRSALSSWRNL